MPWVAITLVLVTSFCFASHCPDPRLQQAEIGGDTIDGIVLLQHKPLKFAHIRLYFSSGKTAWVGVTDKDGTFRITHLRPNTYRLDVRVWGTTTIHICPESKLSNGQTVFYALQLTDSECIGTTAVTN